MLQICRYMLPTPSQNDKGDLRICLILIFIYNLRLKAKNLAILIYKRCVACLKMAHKQQNYDAISKEF